MDNKAKNDDGRDDKVKSPVEGRDFGKKHGQKGNYTEKIWNKINKSVSEDKISELKSQVQSDPDGEFRKKRKRRRKRKNVDQGGFGFRPEPKLEQTAKVESQHMPEGEMPIDVKSETKLDVEAVVEPVAEPVAEPVVSPVVGADVISGSTPGPVSQPGPPALEESPVPPAPPVVPINPFASDFDNVVPPKGHEHRYDPHEDTAVKVAQPPVSPFDLGPGDDFKVINPFDPTPNDEPLNEKPLEEVRDVVPDTTAFYEEKSAQEAGDSVEAEVQNPFAAHAGVVEDKNVDDGFGVGPDVAEDQDFVSAQPPINNQVIELNAEPVLSEPAVNEVLEVDDFKNEFWHILEQAGISKKGIVIFSLLFVFGVFALLGYFFDWYKFFDFGKGGGKTEISNEVQEPKVVESSSKGSIAGIVSSFIFGLEYAQLPNPIIVQPIGAMSNIAGIDYALLLGKNDDLSAELFVSYVDLLGKMENIYNVDVYELVNLAVDRRAALEDYLSQMDSLINEGLSALSAIESDLASIGLEYDAKNVEKEQYEALFFNNTQVFYGQTAYDNLRFFMQSDQAAVELKARYSAYNTLRTMFINDLNFLRPKYKDISINSEALIKGIKVFDVPKSDIDAILPAP